MFRIGPAVDLTYPVNELGNDLVAPRQAARRRSREAFDGKDECRRHRRHGRARHRRAPMRPPAPPPPRSARASACCTPPPSRVGALDLGFATDGGIEAIRAGPAASRPCSCSAPTSWTSSAFADTFTVYIGTHGDRGVAPRRRDPARPPPTPRSTAPTSISRAGCSSPRCAVHPPGEAREDWTIFRALSDVLGKTAAVRRPRRSFARAIAAEVPRLGVAGLEPGRSAARLRRRRRRASAARSSIRSRIST